MQNNKPNATANKGNILENLTDEQVLKEFVKRFKCDAAILVYLDSDIESGFGRWSNKAGKKWVDETFKKLQEDK